jgi:hypothetical protein
MTDLHQECSLIPIDVLVGDATSLIETHHRDVWQHNLADAWDALIDLSRGKSSPSRAAMANREAAALAVVQGHLFGSRVADRPDGNIFGCCAVTSAEE